MLEKMCFSLIKNSTRNKTLTYISTSSNQQNPSTNLTHNQSFSKKIIEIAHPILTPRVIIKINNTSLICLSDLT